MVPINRMLLRTAIVAVLVVVAPAANAWAEPTPQQLEEQIDQAWNTLEPVIEQYNAVHTELKANQAKAADLQKQLQPLQEQVDAAMARVSAIAVAAYKGGPGARFNALLGGGSPSALVQDLALLNQLAVGEKRQISAVAIVRDKYLADKKVLDDLIGRLAAQDTDLATKKKDIEAQLANLQKLRQAAYGNSTGTGSLRPAACPYEYIGGAPGTAGKTACAQISKPYVWAADGPSSFDCSGLTLYAWAAAGVKLRHYTKWQYDDTKRVSRADLRVGDLVFYYGDLHHVALYVGGGWVVHAPHPGDVVRMVQITKPGSPSAYGRV